MTGSKHQTVPSENHLSQSVSAMPPIPFYEKGCSITIYGFSGKPDGYSKTSEVISHASRPEPWHTDQTFRCSLFLAFSELQTLNSNCLGRHLFCIKDRAVEESTSQHYSPTRINMKFVQWETKWNYRSPDVKMERIGTHGMLEDCKINKKQRGGNRSENTCNIFKVFHFVPNTHKMKIHVHIIRQLDKLNYNSTDWFSIKLSEQMTSKCMTIVDEQPWTYERINNSSI